MVSATLMSGKRKPPSITARASEKPPRKGILSSPAGLKPDKSRAVIIAAIAIVFVCMAAALSALLSGSGRNGQQFSGERAFGHVKAIVELGPRPSGSEALKKAGEYIRKELAGSGLETRDDNFRAGTPIGEVAMNNIVGVLKGNRDDLLIVGTHYESKYFKTQHFVGANDGGSGTAVSLEAARVLAGRKERGLTIWFVFFDGEEAFKEWSDRDSLYGSRHFAAELKKKGLVPKVKAFLLLDMVGDRDLGINNDACSTGWLREMMHGAADELGFQQYFNGPYMPIQDDHIPFLELSIPSLDIIDMNYPYWHSPEDLLNRLSPESLGIVGSTLIRMTEKLDERFAR